MLVCKRGWLLIGFTLIMVLYNRSVTNMIIKDIQHDKRIGGLPQALHVGGVPLGVIVNSDNHHKVSTLKFTESVGVMASVVGARCCTLFFDSAYVGLHVLCSRTVDIVNMSSST